MVALDGTKMSKSLGNLVFVEDLLERFDGGALRRYFLQHHYRSDWTYDDDAAVEAAARFKVWQDAAQADGRAEELEIRFHQAMADDLDTPTAIQIVDEVADAGAGATLRELAALLGLELG
jgi:L-cysteine:1D-myo-inositol 2-amino-2-deoxy-alpha-D-glucopyranoside ligase